MKATNVTTTNTGFSVSTTTGSGIKGVQISVCRFPKKTGWGMLKGQLNGLTVETHEQADALLLTYGYTKQFGRNTCKFVMSRAARKHGMTTTDYGYTRNAARAGK